MEVAWGFTRLDMDLLRWPEKKKDMDLLLLGDAQKLPPNLACHLHQPQLKRIQFEEYSFLLAFYLINHGELRSKKT